MFLIGRFGFKLDSRFLGEVEQPRLPDFRGNRRRGVVIQINHGRNMAENPPMLKLWPQVRNGDLAHFHKCCSAAL